LRLPSLELFKRGRPKKWMTMRGDDCRNASKPAAAS
jgi:hypothetical protein